jgi:hypothetical protein
LQRSTTSVRRRNRREADHFIATQRLEERLKAATNQAAHPAVDDLHLADTDGRCDLSGWGAGDERHLDSSAQELIVLVLAALFLISLIGSRRGRPRRASNRASTESSRAITDREYMARLNRIGPAPAAERQLWRSACDGPR